MQQPHRRRRLNAPLAISLILLLLTACTTITPRDALPERPNQGDLLGEVGVNFAVSPVSRTLEVSAATPPLSTQGTALSGVELRNLSKGIVDKDGVRYLYGTFEVTNTSGSALDNLTFYALNRSDGFGGTALYDLREMDGTAITDPLFARSVLPTHRMEDESGTLRVEDSEADFQAFSEAEAAAVQSQGTLSADGSTVLEYGYVARNASGGRSIAAGGKGLLTVAVKYEYEEGVTRRYPYSFSLSFAAVNESVTRVTRSAEEAGTAAVCSRASAVGASEVVVFGDNPSSVPSGCTIIYLDDVKIAIPSSVGGSVYLLGGEVVGSEVFVAVDDADVFASPYNWRKDGSALLSNNPGAYIKLGFTGTSFRAGFDTSAQDSLGVASHNYPHIRVTVDGVSNDLKVVPGSPTITLAEGLSGGSHTIEIGFRSTLSSYDRWTLPTNTLKISGFQLDNGARTAAASVRPKKMLLFADSHGEGVRINNSNNNPSGNDALSAFSRRLANELDAELGNVSFSGQGWAVRGSGGVTEFHDPADSLKTWERYSSNHSRLPLAPSPDYVFVLHGHNDYNANRSDSAITARAQAWLGEMRDAVSDADIFLVVPFKGFKRSALSAAFANYTAAQPSDKKVYFLDLGAAAEDIVANNSHDGGTHMNGAGHVLMTSELKTAVTTALANGGGGDDGGGDDGGGGGDDGGTSSGDIAPDTLLRTTRLSGTLADLQDDPDAPDAEWLTATGSYIQLKAGFGSPAADLETGAPQEFKLLVRKTPGDSDPRVRLEVRESGSWRASGSYTSVTSETGQVVSLTWDASRLDDLSGAEVEIRVINQPGANGERVDLGALVWKADTVAD